MLSVLLFSFDGNKTSTWFVLKLTDPWIVCGTNCVVVHTNENDWRGQTDNQLLFGWIQVPSLMNRLGKFSSVVKSKSAVVKEKMINYIKNEQQPTERSVM